MTRNEFVRLFRKLVRKYKYRVYRKYPNVRSKGRFGICRALFAWCYVKEIRRGEMLTPITLVYLHRYYYRRLRRGEKAKFLSYMQERRAATKLGLNEYNYTVISAATDKDYRDLCRKQERLAIALRKRLIKVCVVMGKNKEK